MSHKESDFCSASPVTPDGPHFVTEAMRVEANALMADAHLADLLGDVLEGRSAELFHLSREVREAAARKKRRATAFLLGT
jgi:hypothetical protein